MGDRGNIKLVGEHTFPHPAYLYTHWGGCDMQDTLREALDKGRDRWNDGQYLARVIFQTLLGDDNGITGFGLSTEPGDNEHPFLVVDVDKNLVWQEPDNRKGFPIGGAKLKPTSFEDFLKLVPAEAEEEAEET